MHRPKRLGGLASEVFRSRERSHVFGKASCRVLCEAARCSLQRDFLVYGFLWGLPLCYIGEVYFLLMVISLVLSSSF